MLGGASEKANGIETWETTKTRASEKLRRIMDGIVFKHISELRHILNNSGEAVNFSVIFDGALRCPCHLDGG